MNFIGSRWVEYPCVTIDTPYAVGSHHTSWVKGVAWDPLGEVYACLSTPLSSLLSVLGRIMLSTSGKVHPVLSSSLFPTFSIVTRDHPFSVESPGRCLASTFVLLMLMMYVLRGINKASRRRNRVPTFSPETRSLLSTSVKDLPFLLWQPPTVRSSFIHSPRLQQSIRKEWIWCPTKTLKRSNS